MKKYTPNYIKKHWKGQLPLWVSFWVNYFGLYWVFWVLGHVLVGRKSYLSPILSARFAILITLAMLLTYPWRIVGLWRCCTNYSMKHGKSVRIMLIHVIIVLGVLTTVSVHIIRWPTYMFWIERSFYKDPIAQYTLTLRRNGTLIHLEGSMGYGVSRDIKKLVSANPEINGIILDTPGGRAYEGRQLAKLIREDGFDTYSLEGCGSAGAISFLAGKKRYLASDCPLVFHRAEMEKEHLAKNFKRQEIQKRDFQIYPSEEIEKTFFEKALSELETNEYWIPTTQELLDTGAINEIVEIQDVLGPDELDG